MFILKTLYIKIYYTFLIYRFKKKRLLALSVKAEAESTLLRMLNDLQSPTSGTIEYNGKLISDYHPIQLRRDVVMLGQTPPIFDGTVKDNLLMGLRLSENHFQMMMPCGVHYKPLA